MERTLKLRRNKYGAIACSDGAGNLFDSKGERSRHGDLKVRQMAGLIENLVLKPEKVVLIAMEGTKPEIAWQVDFSYYDKEDGLFVYEDYKPRPMARYEHLLIRLWRHYGPAPLRISTRKRDRFTIKQTIHGGINS